MQVDWEFEIGGDAPVIDAGWPGFVDLRIRPLRVDEIVEVAGLPSLRNALVRLNAHPSPVWTSKCDVWEPEEFDRDELDAETNEAMQALACYVDLLPRSQQQWSLPERALEYCSRLCAKLREVPLPNCRVDLVVRRAWIAPELQDIGITAYLTGCGADRSRAGIVLGDALHALADVVVGGESSSNQDSHYNGENPGE